MYTYGLSLLSEVRFGMGRNLNTFDDGFVTSVTHARDTCFTHVSGSQGAQIHLL